MRVIKHLVALGSSEVRRLEEMVRKGKESARVIRRAQTLLMADENGSRMTDEEIMKALRVVRSTISQTRKRYSEGGIENALYEKPRPGKERVLDGKQEAMVTAIACTDPPEGNERWTLDLLQEEVGERVKEVGRSTVYRVLLKNDLKPWRKKNVVHSYTYA